MQAERACGNALVAAAPPFPYATGHGVLWARWGQAVHSSPFPACRVRSVWLLEEGTPAKPSSTPPQGTPEVYRVADGDVWVQAAGEAGNTTAKAPTIETSFPEGLRRFLRFRLWNLSD